MPVGLVDCTLPTGEAIDASRQSFPPVTGAPFGVHNGDYPNLIFLFQEDHQVGKLLNKGTPGRWIKLKISPGLATKLGNRPFDFTMEAGSKLWGRFRRNSGPPRHILHRRLDEKYVVSTLKDALDSFRDVFGGNPFGFP